MDSDKIVVNRLKWLQVAEKLLSSSELEEWEGVV